MPQDPWAEFRTAQPQQAPGVIYGPPKQPDPVELENLRLRQEANARAAAGEQRAQTEFEQEQAQRAPTDSGDRTQQIRIALENLDSIESAVKNAWLGSGVGSVAGSEGFRGSTLAGMLGMNQSANNIAGQLEMVQGDLINQVRLEMARQGVTVGASQANTEREAARLAASIANLSQTQDEATFLGGIQKAREYYQRLLQGQGGGEPAPNPPATGGGGDFDSAAYWGGEFYDEGGSPLGPDGGPGYDKNGRYIGMFGGNTEQGLDGGKGGGGGGLLNELGTATAATAKGAAKAVTGLYDFGIDVAKGVEGGITYGLTHGGGAVLDAVGANGDWLREAGDRSNEVLANQPTASGALDKVWATPPGYEGTEFASSLVAGMMLPGPKAVPKVSAPAATMSRTAAREVVDAGKQAGVRVMTSDVRPPKTFIGKAAQSFGERIPVAGTGGARAAQQEERIKAVKDLARDFGADVAGDYLDDVAADLAKTRGSQLSGLTRAKDAVIDGVQGVFTAPRTVAAIDEQIARLRGINEGAFAPVIQKLEAFKANILSGKTLREVEGNRKLLGDMFEDPNLASIRGDGQKAINAIYGPLREDMGAFIREASGDGAYRKWAAANERLAALAGELDSTAFRNVLRNAETTPEQVARLLFSKSPSEVRRLYSNLSPEGQAKARAGIIALAVERAGGLEAVSPDKFANAIAQNSRAAGVVFQGADLARLRGLERLLQATKRASVAAASPPTGVQNAPLIGAYVAGSTGPVSIPVLVGAGGLARFYESPATRNLLIGLSKSAPGSEAESRWIARIMTAAAAQTERMGAVANDVLANSPGRAAAQDEQQPR